MNFVIEPTLSNTIIMLLAITNSIFLLYMYKVRLDYIVQATVFLMFVALVEPAPSDLFFFPVLIFSYKERIFSKDKYLKMRYVIWILFLYLFVAGLSMFNIQDYYSGMRFYGVSWYLIIFCLTVFFYVHKDNSIPLLRTYIISCIVASIIGIIGYFGYFSEYLRMDEWRTKSLFKDPNVFGAYLTPSIILLIADLKAQTLFLFKKKEQKNRKYFEYFNIQVLFNIFLTIIIMTGIFIAFSRGAWVSLTVGIFTLLILNIKKLSIIKINYKRFIIYFSIFITIVLFVWFGVFSIETRDFFIQRISLKHYDFDRFSVQAIGIKSALDRMFGYGPGQFERVIYEKIGNEYSAHSLYVRLLLENGVIGFLLIMAVFLFLVVKLFQLRKMEKENMLSSVYISILASLFVNSLVIDSLHWRHFWLLIGVCLSYISEYQEVKRPKLEWCLNKYLEKSKVVIVTMGKKIRSLSFFLIRNILAFLGVFPCIMKGHENEILILIYHRVDDDIDMELSVKLKKFNWQMEYLKNKNYKVISMEEAYQMIHDNSIYGKYIVLTFDDGYEDFYMNAFPILKKFSYPSIIYLVPGYIGSDKIFPWDEKYGESKLINWEQLKELSEDKLIVIGSHTLNHYDLNLLEKRTIRQELEESKMMLEEKTGKHVIHFAYPRGIYSEEVNKILNDYYKTGVLIFKGVKVGNFLVKKDYYQLKRIPIYRSDTRFLFIARIKGWIWLEEVIRKKYSRFLK